MTATGAFKEEYSRKDLVEKLNLQPDLYFPSEDSMSVLIIDDIIRILSLKGSNKFYFSDPIFDEHGFMEISETNALNISAITGSELIITDESMNFAFMSIYDSFTTLLLSREENIDNLIKEMKCEAIICDNDTFIQWYL